jgi:hypothetical protein
VPALFGVDKGNGPGRAIGGVAGAVSLPLLLERGFPVFPNALLDGQFRVLHTLVLAGSDIVAPVIGLSSACACAPVVARCMVGLT